ncbi:MAG: NRDE family protein [Syntrophales bacterium]|nr:NRDE family protein [Syntrophales bacterium]
MCLMLMAYRTHPDYPLIVAANRDEFYERPTQAADFWKNRPDILGGRDLRDGGTWLGITRKGRFAGLTNFRDPASLKTDAPSRGKLVSRFLTGSDNPSHYLDYLKQYGGRYNGFSLIFGEIDALYHYCNRSNGGLLTPGIHGLSNACLDVPWPKVLRGKEGVEQILKEERRIGPDAFFDLLFNRTRPEDDSLPQTGVGIEWERILSPLFIESPVYGTRSSTVIMVDRSGQVAFEERTFDNGPHSWTSVKVAYSMGEAS